MSDKPIVIHWFRRDLRLGDNTALNAAVAEGYQVLPVFIFDRRILKSERIGGPRLRFLLSALMSLDDQLRALGSRLVVRSGSPSDVLSQLVDEVDARDVYHNADYTPYACQRDKVVKETLRIPVHCYDDVLLIPPGGVLKDNGDPYVVFTPFKNRWNTLSKRTPLTTTFERADFVPAEQIVSESIPDVAQMWPGEVITIPQADEATAHDLLADFIQQDIVQYDEKRNLLPIAPYGTDRPSGTSYLSPYLRLGILSPRHAYWAARDAYGQAHHATQRDAVAIWVSELTWRDFYHHILYHFPHVLERDFVDTYANLAWRDDAELWQAWCEGQTGYPIIDAPMRQLKAIGWMPNRARMIVASFLTKDLLIHWRAGDVYFMQHLIDGDPAANNGGWQWAAGTGTDAQPYFRIFNPISQSKKFASPQYLRYWLPELAGVPDKHIHSPWEMSSPPRAYPAPIVDHGRAREETLQAFKTARGER